MLNAFKLVWKKIPKKLAAIVVVSLISYIAKRFYDYYFEGQPFLSFSKLYEAVFWITGGLLGYFIITYFYSSLRVISELLKKEPQKSIAEIDNAIDKSKKKEMPSRFELQPLNFDYFEVKVFVTRKWRPNSNPPGVEDFLRELEFSDIYCGQCKSEFIVIYGLPLDLYRCPNCINEKVFSREERFDISQKIEADFKGELRRNFEKYWGKYKKLYLDFTRNKPEEFEEPVR